MRSAPSTTARVRLPATVSVGMSRRLLTTRIAQASAPTPTAAYERRAARRSRSGRTSCRPPRPGRRRRRPSPRPGRGSRRAWSRRCRTTRPAPTPAPTATSHHAVEAASTSPATPATPKARNAARFTAPGRGGAGADQPHRADPVGVGAADAVGVVVGVVDRDLERQAHDQREQRLPPDRVVDVRRDAGAGERPARPPRAGSAAVRRPATDRGSPRGAIQAGARSGTSVRRRGFARDDGRGRGRADRPGSAASDDEPLVVETSGLDRDAEAGGAVPAGGARVGRRDRAPAGRRGPLAARAARRRTSPARRSSAARWWPGEPPVLLEEHASLAAAVEAGRPAYASLVPTQLHRMLDSPEDVAALRSLRTVLLGGGPIDPALRGAGGRGGGDGGGDVRLGGDRRRLRLRRRRARRGRAGHRDGRAAADLGADALRRVRRRPGADRAGAGRRLVPHRGRRPDRRGRPAAGARPARRHRGQRRRQRAGTGGGGAGCARTRRSAGRGARRPRRGVGHRGWSRSWSAT